MTRDVVMAQAAISKLSQPRVDANVLKALLLLHDVLLLLSLAHT